MFPLIHDIATWYLRRRMREIRTFMDYPGDTQQEMLSHLVRFAQFTAFGQQHGFHPRMSVREFQERVPVSSYEELYPWIERTFSGDEDILWPGAVQWYAKSSGTTNDRSKYIPLSEDSLEDCHYQVGRDMLTLYLETRENSRLFTGKSLSIGGSHQIHPHGSHARSGDLSGVLIENLPAFYKLYRVPSKEVALMPEWETKAEAMAREVMLDDVTSMAGVPTWTLVLINRMLQIRAEQGRPCQSLLDIWPNMEVFFHGGVAFGPYREQFDALIPRSSGMRYMECYNASEGFFALGDDPSRDDMLLMLDYGIFYEFIPLEHLGERHPPAYTVEDVEIGKNYAMAISTNGGLWRYLIGDTVVFTQKVPARIRITGRTKQFINAFGEELMVENAERALSEACSATGAKVANFTVAPVYFDAADSLSGGLRSGAHEWLVEFDEVPADLAAFHQVLDDTLRRVNSDYDAKRHKDLALRMPMLRVLPAGTFYAWMRRRNKLGGQNKVPRLSNDRQYVDDVIAMLEGQ